MQIDLDTQAVAVYSFQGCGQGEGYSLLGSVGLAVQRLANLGANVEWFDMDGPLYHGHYDTGPIGCQLSIPDTITRTVQNMKDVLAVYPHAKLIDGEPCPAIAQLSPTWQADLTEFYTGLAQQLGTPVRGLQLDVNWDTPSWAQAMVDINTYLHYQNMGLGVIWDGTANNTTDADWINAAISHFEAVEGRLQIIPQEAIFTTWDANPADNLPETSPTAQTWLINRYFRPRSTIQAQFVGLGAQGTLTDMAGNPIPNVTVNGYKPGVDFSQPLPVTTVTGVVPAGAVQAGIVVRVNTECAGCNGLNDLLYGTMQYQETQGGSAQASFSTINLPAYLAGGTIVTTEIVGGTQVQRIIASPGQIAMWNGPAFPVTAGAQYQFTVPAGTIGGLGWFGNVDLIWLNSSVAEMARVIVVSHAAKRGWTESGYSGVRRCQWHLPLVGLDPIAVIVIREQKPRKSGSAADQSPRGCSGN
jgi:hypothetical protein